MALTIGDNFSYMGAKPLDARLKYDTVANMKAMADSVLYDGCLAYCVATDKTYQWKSTNTVDPTLGKWREFETGGGSTYTAGDGIVIDDDEISTDNMPAEDMSEIVTPLPGVMSRRFKYSTDEQVVGEWIDGKPIYQKTLTNLSKTLSAGWQTFASITNIETLVDCKFYAVSNGGAITDAVDISVSGDDVQIQESDGGQVVYHRTINILTLQYTKNTD